MKFFRDETTDLTILKIEEGAITIGETTVTEDVALTAERIIRGWRRTALSRLTVDDLEAVLAEDPEMIVLGTGREQRFPPQELTFALARRGIGLEAMDTPAACRTFNILVAEGRRPAAVLMLEAVGE